MNKNRQRLRLSSPKTTGVRHPPPLRITPYAWRKLLFLRDLGPTEVGPYDQPVLKRALGNAGISGSEEAPRRPRIRYQSSPDNSTGRIASHSGHTATRPFLGNVDVKATCERASPTIRMVRIASSQCGQRTAISSV